MQQQISQAKQLQTEGGLPSTMQEDLQKLEGTLENMQQTMEKREEQLQVGPLQVEIKTCAFFFFFDIVINQIFTVKNLSSLSHLSESWSLGFS